MRATLKKINIVICFAVFIAFNSCKIDGEQAVNMEIIEDKLISIDDAKAMSIKFVRDLEGLQKMAMQDSMYQEGNKMKISASAAFSLEEIETYIQYAKKEAVSKGFEMDGLRLYFGVYTKGDKKDYTTMFFAPTGKKSVQQGGFILFNGNSEDLEVPPLNTGNQGHPPSATYPQ
jgi:hypothetical protein